MRIELSPSWTKKLAGRIEKYQFEVGILEDKPHYEADAQAELKTYAGGKIRKTSRKKSGVTVGDVLVENMERLNVNLLLKPFQEKSSEIIKFTKEFLKSALANKDPKRVENLLQAIVRNPILKKEYGDNDLLTATSKGFNRHLFDTGQMFKAIKARVKRV